MIKRIRTLDILNTSLVAKRTEAYYKAYGGDYDFCLFFTDGNALIMRYENSLYISGTPKDREEISCFIKSLSLPCIMDSESYSLIGDIEGYKTVPLYTMSKAGTGNNNKDCFTTDYRAVYDILKSAFSLSEDDFPMWYTDTCHRVRHDVSRLILNKDKTATATVLFYDENSCFLSHIGVKNRGKGIGKEFLTDIEKALKGKIYLHCKLPLLGFYRACGFSQDDKPGAYELIKEV